MGGLLWVWLSSVGQTNNGDFCLQNHLTVKLHIAVANCFGCNPLQQTELLLGKETCRQVGINTFTYFVHLCCLHTHSVPALTLYKLLFSITFSNLVFLYNFPNFQLRPKPVCHIFLIYLNLGNCLGFFCEFQAVCFEILGHKWLKRCRISSSFETQANFYLFFSSPQQRIKVIMFSCHQWKIKHLIFYFSGFQVGCQNFFFFNFSLSMLLCDCLYFS